MGYYVKALPSKRSAPSWKVQYISFKKEDTVHSKARKPKREWDISKTRWSSLGFNIYMNLQEAKSRARQLNAQHILKLQEERLIKIAEKEFESQTRFDSVLPMEFVSEFEARFIRTRDSQTDQHRRRHTRAFTRWRAAQKLIVAVGMEPSEWFYNSDLFYDYFFVRKMSIRYLQSILSIANLWGFYICRKLARPFLPVRRPLGYERQRLIVQS